MNQYTILAQFYDILNADVNYKEWAMFLHNTIQKYKNDRDESKLILDLACGSGNITLEMAKLGYDMIGIDLSVDMLMKAREKAECGEYVRDILWLNQDMCGFELYGTVDAVICCLDSINYITNEEDLPRCFRLIYNYLNPDGLFIFDVNSPYKFEKIYGNNDYILEADNLLCAWHNKYNKRSGICEFHLNIFEENENGTYNRYYECHKERMYQPGVLNKILNENGFEVLNITSDHNYGEVKNNSERLYFICRAKK